MGGGSTQVRIEDLLDAFDENYSSPTDPVRSLPSQAHFDQQLEVTNDFEGSCKPLVPCVLFDPCARVPRVVGGWDKGLVLDIRLHDPVEQRVMVQTDRVQQRRH